MRCFITCITSLLLSVTLREALRSFSAAPAAVIAWLAAGFPILSFSYQAPVVALRDQHQLSLLENRRAAVHISGLTCAVLEMHPFLICVSSSPLRFPWLSFGYLRPFFLSLSCCLEAKSASAVAVSSLETNSSIGASLSVKSSTEIPLFHSSVHSTCLKEKSKVETYQRKVISSLKINRWKIQSFISAFNLGIFPQSSLVRSRHWQIRLSTTHEYSLQESKRVLFSPPHLWININLTSSC